MSYYLVHPRTADNYIDIIDKDKPKKPVDPDDCPPEKVKNLQNLLISSQKIVTSLLVKKITNQKETRKW